MKIDPDCAACDNCGHVTHISNLDAKPARLAGPGSRLAVLTGHRARQIADALEFGEDFDRLECRACYGPGYTQGTAY